MTKRDIRKELSDTITNARWMLDLSDGWGDGVGCKIKEEIFKRVEDSLMRLVPFIEKNHSFSVSLLEISPVTDGSIDVFLKTANNFELLVNYDDNQKTSFYGTNFEDKEIKGIFDPLGEQLDILLGTFLPKEEQDHDTNYGKRKTLD